jgi:hypothetical protein
LTTLTPQQAFDICQADKTAWLNLKTEREKAEQALNAHLSGDSENCPVRVAALRGRIEVKKWQINRAAGRYIRSHETLQHVSIQNGLRDLCRNTGPHWPPCWPGIKSAERSAGLY